MAPQTIVITGTSSGFGKATVEHFAARGWNVAATVRRPQDHPTLFAQFPNVTLFPLDVTNQAQVDRLAAATRAAYGSIDVLVNNAGQLLMGPLETSTMEQIRAQYETNVFGLIMVTKAFIPLLRAQGYGMIMNVASASAKANLPFLAAYGSSKWAVAGLSEALAVELAPFGIKVKTIFPGAHATKIFTKIANGLTPDAVAAAAAVAYRPYFANFLAVQDGVSHVTSPRNVAHLIYRVARANSDQTDYLAGRDAVLQVLLRRLLPQRVFKRMLVSSILRPPPQLMLRLVGWLIGGTERVEVDRGALS